MKFVRIAKILSLKNKEIEASLFLNSMQLEINDNKLNIADINDTKGKFETWFYNKSTNKVDSDSGEEGKRDRGKKEDKNNKLN